ncbi:hypothetical protein [Paraglaciecola sp.]|uniref:hypothetical protein n=1 Tax=Paraglaciecola sp. TaxID=1920173 RepID=UPI003EF94BE8
MIKTITITLFLIALTGQTQGTESCVAENFVKAEYQIQINKTNRAEQSTTLILWRKGTTVAHQYPATQISEAWQNISSKKQLIKPIRYFEAHKRAIEYQPGEVVHGKKESDWSYRAQLVSDKLLNEMTLTQHSGSGCDEVQTYTKNTGKKRMSLEWYSKRKLVKSFQITSKHSTETWALKNVVDNPSMINAYFRQLNNYQTTDFADIGDDHTDSFLTNMVTLGFIEAGASGFYDDKGQALGGHHQH